MRTTEALQSDAPSAVEHDLGPLAWVLDELRKSLEGAVKSMRRFLRENAQSKGSELTVLDPAALRQARQYLHQASGALEMVGVPAVALMLRSMEQVAQKFAQEPSECTEPQVQVLERASFAISEYLETLLAGHKVSPVGLFPQFRDVQQLLGVERVHPADLWPHDARAVELVLPVTLPPLAYGPEVRGRFDQAVLRLVKTGRPAAARELSDLSAGLSQHGSQGGQLFWKVAAAFFEALALERIALDVYVKRVISRVLAQYSAMARGEGSVSERLLQDLLFYCAQAREGGEQTAPLLQSVRRAYQLEDAVPADYEKPRFGRFDPSVLIQARKRIAAATEAWSALSGGDKNKLKIVVDQFGLVSDSLKRLHPDSSMLGEALLQAVESTVQAGTIPSPGLAMEVATSVLYLQAVYQDLDADEVLMSSRSASLAQRLQRVQNGAEVGPLEPWMEELYRRVSERQTMGSVVDELRSTLGGVEQSLDAFFRNPSEAQVLSEVPAALSQMRGVLSVLGLDQAAHASMRMRDSVERLMVDEVTDDAIRAGTFERLGNSLGALGFLIDMLSYQRALAKTLFVYDESAGEFKLVPGRERRKPVVPESFEGTDKAPDLSVAPASDFQSALPQEVFESPDEALAIAGLDEIAPPPAELRALAEPDAATAAQELDEDDLLQVFLEEAHEVLGHGAAAVAELRHDGARLTDQTTLRRAFHTLKGSSRMVGLNEFGEAAWALEQLHNTWLADQRPADASLLKLSSQALAQFGLWARDIAAHQADAWRAQPFRDAADALRLEGRLIELAADHEPGTPDLGGLEPALEFDPLPIEPFEAVETVETVEAVEAVDQAPADESVTPVQTALPQVPDLMTLPPDFLDLEPAQAPIVITEADSANTPSSADAMPLELHAPARADDESLLDDLDFDRFDNDLSTVPMPLEVAAAPVEPPELEQNDASDFGFSLDFGPQPTAPTLPELSFPDEFGVHKDSAPEVSEPTPFAFDLSETPELKDVSTQEPPPAPLIDSAVTLSDPVTEGPEELGALDFPYEAEALPQAEVLPQVDVLPLVSEPLVETHAEVSPEPLSQDVTLDSAQAELLVSGVADDDSVKVIGDMRLSIPLYNVYLNEADEWSRRLQVSLAEWALELHEPIPDVSVAMAHSLAGSSATVGFKALSHLSRTLEHALQHVQLQAQGTPDQAEAFGAAVEDIRRLLHQFAAGFLKEPHPAVMLALEDILATEYEAGPLVLPGYEDEFDANNLSQHEPQAGEAAPELTELGVPLGVGEPTEVASNEPAFQTEELAADLQPLDESSTTDSAPVLPLQASEADSPKKTAPSPWPGHELGLDEEIDAQDVIDAELFGIFEEEALELMPRIAANLRQWHSGLQPDAARSEVLRLLHTLKGSARLAGALRLGEMAHRMESAIESFGTSTDPVLVEGLIQRFDAMQSSLDTLRFAGSASPLGTGTDSPDQLAQSLAPASAERSVVADLHAPLVTPVASPLAPRTLVGQSVRVRSQLLDRLVNQAGEVMISRSRMESRMGQLRGSLGDLTGNLDRLRQQLRDIEVQAESQMQSRLAQAKDSAAGFDPLEFDRFTRVQELTRMMAESVNDVATVQRTLQRTVESTEDELVAQARQARELQRDLLRTRMVEFEGISERLYAVARQAAKETGKQIKLDITGGHIEMDRGVLDRMTPAFEHLLRNAITHGIESPEVREAAGKVATGAITVSVEQTGNDVSVQFADDGAGLDLDLIRLKAQAMGLVAPGQTLDDAEAAALIYTAGFSTASEVTELAGRGIGMDVVRTDVYAVGGRIETNTSRGLGSRFKMVLPLTTAVTQVVMLRIGQSNFGVPSNLVEIVRRSGEQELSEAYQTGEFDLGVEKVPFFWGGALLKVSRQSADPATRTRPVVIFRSASQRIAMHVDEVLGNQEVVVKNLGPQLSRLPGLAGMSVLASGAVVLIYNPVALSNVYGAQIQINGSVPDQLVNTTGAELAGAAQAAALKAPLILVVDDSITVRRVTQRLLQREGYRVALASDGLQALERLQEERPVVVLSDIEMPRMDGFDLTRNIRHDDKLSDLPIIMITSRIAGKHREHAMELGVNHYLGKPYSEDELLALVLRYATAALTSAGA
jgi:chemosensory pili system protein ChpA (sensor histidine kinase/response regulator)